MFANYQKEQLSVIRISSRVKFKKIIITTPGGQNLNFYGIERERES